MDKDTIASLRQIDDAFKGEDDINDLTEVHDTTFLKSGPSAKMVYKMLNAHNKSVDSMQLKKAEDKYGKIPLAVPGQDLTIPSFREVARILGQSDGDSDDDDDEGEEEDTAAEGCGSVVQEQEAGTVNNGQGSKAAC